MYVSICIWASEIVYTYNIHVLVHEYSKIYIKYMYVYTCVCKFKCKVYMGIFPMYIHRFRYVFVHICMDLDIRCIYLCVSIGIDGMLAI